MAELLVDTDVCIDHLVGRRRLPRGAGRLGYSVITRAELLAGANDDDEPNVRRLLAGMDENPRRSPSWRPGRAPTTSRAAPQDARPRSLPPRHWFTLSRFRPTTLVTSSASRGYGYARRVTGKLPGAQILAVRIPD